jgi:ABC-2 type transport system permease protein
MSRLWVVVRREYLERVRSRAFLIGTLIAPLLLSVVTLAPRFLASRQSTAPLHVSVIDAAGPLLQAAESGLRAHQDEGRAAFVVEPAGAGVPEEQRQRAKAAVLAGQLDAYIYIPPDGFDQARAEYHGRNVNNRRELALVEGTLQEALLARRLAESGLPPERLRDFTQQLELKTVKVSASGEREDRGGSFLLAFTLLMALYVAIAMWGAALMNGVIEEKANRVVEVVVSSLPTSTLFAGKLLGVGGAGLTQFLTWSSMAGVLGLYGVQGALLAGVRLPEIPLHVLVFFVIFFLLGFLLYGSLYMTIGAAVNSTQEAQSLVFPATLPLILGMVLFPAVINDPDGMLATVLSLVPFWTPLLMFLRIALLTPPAWQIALSVLLTALSVVGVLWFASRVYRVGILMYGKRPTLPEIVRWAGRA